MRTKKLSLSLLCLSLTFFILPTQEAHADLSLTTADSIVIKTVEDNVTGCSCPVSPGGAPGCPAGPGMALNTQLSSVTASLASTPPGTYVYTLSCTSPSFYSAQARLVVSAAATAPTTAPFLSINTPSGTVTTPWTLNWSGGNNSPTFYEMQITGPFPGMSWTSQGLGVMSNGPRTIAEFGLGAGTYNFWVRACNSKGCGPASNMVSFTASAPAPTVNINFSMKIDEMKRKLHQMFSRNETTSHPLASSLR